MTKETKTELTGSQAFVLAIQEAKNAVFNKKNPHFGNRYADEKACKEATDPALHKYGLAMVHTINVEPSFYLETRIVDGYNTIMSSSFPLSMTKPQDMGSQITYAKRYNRCALMGIISDEDDDADATRTITKEQVKILDDLIVASGSNKELFLKDVKAESLETMPAFNFEVAKGKLEHKLRVMKNGTKIA
jgi:hypothetical protein